MKSAIPWKIAAVLLIAALALLSLSYLTAHELHPDEAHYWSWSRHPAAGYFDNAPMVAYIVRLSTGLLGKSEFAMRFPSWLVYCILIVLAFLFARRVYGSGRAGLIAAVLFATTPIFLVCNFLITSDTGKVLFAALAMIFAYMAAVEGKRGFWLPAGAALGLGLLSKYQAVLVGFSILLFLIFTKEGRRWLRTPWPYLAALLALLIFSPVIVWNWRNDWVSFRFQLSHGFHGKALQPLGPIIFLLGQAVALSPLPSASFVRAAARTIGKRGERPAGDVFLLFCSLPTPLFFALTSLRFLGDMHWSIDALFPAVVLLGGWIERAWREAAGRRRRNLRVYWATAVAFSLLLAGIVRYPEFLRAGGLLRAGDLPTSYLHGWSGLGRAIDRIADREFPGKNGVPVFVPSYQLGGEVSFYTRDRRLAFLAAPLARRNQFDQYVLAWIGKYAGRGGLLLATQDGFAGRLVPRFFRGAKLVGMYRRTRFGETLDVFHIFRVDGIKAEAIRRAAAQKPLGL